jgi:hypothetical protein
LDNSNASQCGNLEESVREIKGGVIYVNKVPGYRKQSGSRSRWGWFTSVTRALGVRIGDSSWSELDVKSRSGNCRRRVGNVELAESKLAMRVGVLGNRMDKYAASRGLREEMISAGSDGRDSAPETSALEEREINDAHLSPHAKFWAGTISACRTPASSPHNQPVPHHGALDGVGAPGFRYWLAARAGITYTFPEVESAKTRDSVTCTLVISCASRRVGDVFCLSNTK